jgi:hypothetical protein
MGKMPYTDWKEWAMRRPEWMQEDLGPTFEKFLKRKWQGALNVAAAEPQPWGLEREKTTASKTPQGPKGTNKTTGIVNVVNQQPPHRTRSPTWDPRTGPGGSDVYSHKQGAMGTTWRSNAPGCRS